MRIGKSAPIKTAIMVLAWIMVWGAGDRWTIGHNAALAAERTNLAVGKTAAASNVYQNNPKYGAAKAVDGQSSTRWAADTSGGSYWLQVDLGREHVADQFIVREYQSRMTSYSIQYSLDAVTWKTATSGSKAPGPADTDTTLNPESPIQARYVKLVVDAASSGVSVYEFEIYGQIPQGGETMRVTNQSELNDAIQKALPGDTIIMADGIWNHTYIDFSAHATAERPVRLAAETPGKVILSGESGLSLNRPHLIVDGLLFTNGRAPAGKEAVITFNSDYGRITNTAVVDFNPGDTSVKYYWVFFKGANNRLDNSRFEGKDHMQPVIGNNGSGNEKYNKVDHCYFKNIRHTNPNGMETFRIWGYGGNDELGEDGAFFTIEYNLFEHADGDDEIISLKSNRNIVRYNTIIESRGGIVGRSGTTNTIENNIILGGHYPESTGIRISGHNHTVQGNYIQEVSDGALRLTTGEHVFVENHQLDYLTPDFQPLPRAGSPYGYVGHYGWVKNSLVSGNVFVNNRGTDISLGFFYKNHWPGYQMVLLPEDNQISGNIIYKPSGGIAIQTTKQDTAEPLAKFVFKPNKFERNMVYGGGIDIQSPNTPEGIIVIPSTGESANDSAAARIDKAARLFGLKAEGITGGGIAPGVSPSLMKFKPLTSKAVGPSWMK